MTLPLVSLITPVYNAMPYLQDYLDSVIEQTWRPIELIVADDGSTDASVGFIENKLSSIISAGINATLLKLPHNSQSAAFNAALKAVSGDFLTWCDADDILMPECIEKKARFLIDNQAIGMVRNDGLHINGDTNEIISVDSRECDRKTQDIFFDLFHQYTYCYAGCYMIRMSLFDECFPDHSIPESPEGQNLQLLLPPASRTECGFVPEKLHRYMHRSTGHSSMAKSYTQQRTRILNFTKLYKDILPFCACDQSFYLQETEKIESEKLRALNTSMILHARKVHRRQ